MTPFAMMILCLLPIFALYLWWLHRMSPPEWHKALFSWALVPYWYVSRLVLFSLLWVLGHIMKWMMNNDR